MKIISIISLMLLGMSSESKAQEEFEMKKYFMVFLNAVADRPVLDSITASEIQKGHLAHISKMGNEGKCILAGPFLDNKESRGILLMDMATEEEVREICSQDPAVINGRLWLEIRPWYGPANLIVLPKKPE